MIDLHLHSVYSDGSMTPAELVDIAFALGLTHISITDHDTISGVAEAIEHSRIIKGPEIVPAIEFSCHFKGEDIHLLAYYIPLNDTILNDFLKDVYVRRENRFRTVVKRLNDCGFKLDPDEVEAYAPGGMKMSPQIVKVLMDKKILKDEFEAREFVKDYLNTGKPAYVEHGDDPEMVIKFFHDIGAVTSLAHPNKIKDFSIINDVVKMRIDGLEYYYPNVNQEIKKQLWKIIETHNLIPTGGSDFHGIYSDTRIGDGQVPEIIIKALKETGKIFKHV